jgi:hypothetical protein
MQPEMDSTRGNPGSESRIAHHYDELTEGRKIHVEAGTPS